MIFLMNGLVNWHFQSWHVVLIIDNALSYKFVTSIDKNKIDNDYDNDYKDNLTNDKSEESLDNNKTNNTKNGNLEQN
ncbi:hypothetical protein RhiirA5_435988 [Rhizophagus irregularis]|uniref:Uncharacterized protein n=1 Tax=Rhizophagus irregularis TaxID=588596 RepID=A0A2N0NMK6_9GLOM|nr:hypothetical protein RhiirA5_435988 [Rhizophagus irregularis]